MSIKIRLARTGAKKNAMYRIVVADIRSPRDGRYKELLGTFNPNIEPPVVTLNRERITYWIGKGAKPTVTVSKLLKSAAVK